MRPCFWVETKVGGRWVPLLKLGQFADLAAAQRAIAGERRARSHFAVAYRACGELVTTA